MWERAQLCVQQNEECRQDNVRVMTINNRLEKQQHLEKSNIDERV